MAVITISRLVGSKGTSIAQKVAERMNYDYVDTEIIEKIMDQYGEIGFKDVFDTKPSFWDKYTGITKDMLDFFKRVILSIAKSGNVVLIGRGSFVSLGKYADVLDVMIYAPIEDRIKAIMEIRGITDPKKAQDYIIQKEQIRQYFIEQTFNVKWNKIDNFDLSFNTGKLKQEFVVDAIVLAAEELESKIVSSSGLLTSSIEPDPVLDSTVKSILKR
jgi:cytidylate kinase